MELDPKIKPKRDQMISDVNSSIKALKDELNQVKLWKEDVKKIK
jgi:hypothetical protein